MVKKMNEEWRNELVTKGTAYDALANLDQYAELGECLEVIKGLPSAQPEIVKCRECKHMQKDEIFHQCWCNGNMVKLDDYCSHAERKENVQ